MKLPNLLNNNFYFVSNFMNPVLLILSYIKCFLDNSLLKNLSFNNILNLYLNIKLESLLSKPNNSLHLSKSLNTQTTSTF